MTIPTRLPLQSEPPLSPRQSLPTMYDLPSENPEEPGLPDEFHDLQPELLRLTFRPRNYPSEQVFIGSDLNLYYDLDHPNWYKRPDWFGVVGVSRLYDRSDLRLSYVIWQELKSPFVIVELVSPGTENEDWGQTVSQAGNPPTKWEVYEQILRVPYYFVFSRYTDELQAFYLVGGHYEPATLTNGRLAIPELGLSLGLWQGEYDTINRLWLRWFTIEGELILNPSEQATLAQERSHRLAEKLRELGVDPDQIA